jgi:Tol biopolymer transport system component
MPSFSPDGKRVAFNDHDSGQGHSLAVMDFANATNAFSNRVEIYRDPQRYPGWPFFTPDGLEVVFALGSGTDYATIEDPPTGLVVNRSNLWVVDVAAHRARSLDLANGQTLPTRDQNLNYYPTVSPVASGGYFWVFGGYCVNGICKPSTPECSKLDDRCTTNADCCAATPPLLCIGGHCATSPIVR